MASNNYIVRNIDNTNAWAFGNGLSSYLQNNAAVAADIQMTLQALLGNCFFSVNTGMAWWALLGEKT